MHTLPLPPDELHIWRWSLDEIAPQYETLSAEERQRADRLKLPVVRQRFIAGRCALRAILALYTGEPPAALTFTHNADGKPALASGVLHFNLSHSQDHAALAIAANTPVGVDVERLRPLPNLPDMLEMILTEGEKRDLLAVPAGGHERAFLEMWTRKEAVMKAVGGGYRLAKSFAVGHAPPHRLTVIAGAAEPYAGLWVRPLPPDPNQPGEFIGHVAAFGKMLQLRNHNISAYFRNSSK